MNTRITHFDHFGVKHLPRLWHTSDGPETHFENNVTASVLNEAVSNLPIALLVLLVQEKDDISVLRVARAHKSFLYSSKVCQVICPVSELNFV